MENQRWLSANRNVVALQRRCIVFDQKATRSVDTSVRKILESMPTVLLELLPDKLAHSASGRLFAFAGSKIRRYDWSRVDLSDDHQACWTNSYRRKHSFRKDSSRHSSQQGSFEQHVHMLAIARREKLVRTAAASAPWVVLACAQKVSVESPRLPQKVRLRAALAALAAHAAHVLAASAHTFRVSCLPV